MRHMIKTILSILALIGVMMTTSIALADINARDENGDTALHQAAGRGDIEEVKQLIDQGADINARNKNGATPLHEAATVGHPDAIATLVDAGADIEARDEDGLTPFRLAVAAGHPDAITTLLNAGAEYYGYAIRHIITTILSILALIGVMVITNVAVADINARDENGFTVLDHAAARGDIEAIRQLINQGADVNARSENGTTPLHRAAEGGHPDAIATLINADADISTRTKDGKIALDLIPKNSPIYKSDIWRRLNDATSK